MNILVVEDHPITAMGLELVLKEMFNEATVYFATSGASALAQMAEAQFELITLDIILPETDAHGLIYDMQRLQPNCKILIYTNNRDEVYAMRYIALGASGYINKNSSEQDFKMAVHMVVNNNVYVSRSMLRANLGGKKVVNDNNPINKLSKRELELFMQLLTGTSSKKIAETLSVGPSTVATLKGRLLVKLGAKSMVDLVKIADEHGISL